MTSTDTTELASSYDPTEAETKWYPIWEKAGYFAPAEDEGQETYTIVIPPPNVTGALHMGHALTVTLQDMLIRWRRMQGKRTLWLPGTDHAGIATQMVVERALKAEEGKTRYDLGREAFVERVWQWKEQYGSRITTQLRTMGCSLDWSRERFTMDEHLSKAVLEVFVKLHEEGLIYRAERLVNWCPQSHTALSDLEVERLENHQGELYEFAYPLADGSGHIVVATTRPETMLGDTAVAVHPEDERQKDFIGKMIKHPILGYEFPIVADPILVDPEFGTGAVKVTPAHDFNDFETGKRHKLQLFNIFDKNACVLETPEVKDPILSKIDMDAWAKFKGMERFEARKAVKAALKELGLERGSKPHQMALGVSQRTGVVVEPRLSLQWFVDIKPLAEPALEAVKSGETKIVPESWTKTYYHWMENIQDWCISRQLWWGHRIPAWYDSEGNIYVGRSEEEVREKHSIGNDIELTQDEDVLDTWFSSALWPFSTLGWPNETNDLKSFYPNSVLETGFDILFFWVARMMMMGCKFMGKPPFPTIYLHAMVRDKFGDKMSKTKGNVIDPLHLINGCTPEEVTKQFQGDYPDGFPAFGADALRFTLAAMSMSGRDIKLSVERVAGYRAFANKIWNAARFVLMRLEGETPASIDSVKADLEPMDRYILSRLADAASSTDKALEAYRFSDAASSVYQFFWHEFCDWYIELVKSRLFSDDAKSKATAQSTLVYVLDQALRMLHPFMPFITEELWQKLPLQGAKDSICISDFPVGLDHFRDSALEEDFGLLKDAITGIRTVRSESNVPPSKKVQAMLLSSDESIRTRLEAYAKNIAHISKAESLVVADTTTERPAQAGVHVVEKFEVVVSLEGLVDFEEEKSRIEKSIAKNQKDLDKINAKLTNEKFLARAPADVVAKDKDRAAELTTMIAALNESLDKVNAALSR